VYLKRLELQGFKSFAPRTRFDLNPGITAIVGPNGSGKSNIADALRWVLGEHSGKLIRAKKMEEVIFAGSGKRARSEKAEVTIALDNDERWFPIDADEITISRKASRSGDSDYYVNGKHVRLRDLQELMLKAAVSQSSYSIIGQGLVEGVLSLKAEERREMIEEAADIARYRLKIEEAEGRLRATHENIERIRLLVKEIAPRLSQMEKQAQRASDYERVSTELVQALSAYYEHHWHHAQESLTVATANHDQAQAEYTGAKVALETVQRDQEEISGQLEEYRKRAAAVAADRERLDGRARELERRLAVSRERSGILKTRQVELRDELVALAGEHERAKDLITNYEGQRAAAEEVLDGKRVLLEAAQAELSALLAESRESYTHAGDAEDKSRRLQAAANEIKVRIRRLGDTKRNLDAEQSKLDGRRRSIITQMSEQLRVLRSLREQEASLAGEVSDGGGKRRQMEQEVQRLRSELSKLEATQASRQGKLEALETRLAVLEEAQRQTQAGGEDQAISIEGAVGSLFEILRVPRPLEEAIAAALAEQLEMFVFERQGEAVGAVQQIVSQAGPRTYALPMDTLKPVYPLSLMKEKGIVGVAARLIKYPPRFEKVINALLGRTVIVDDIATAIRVVRRGLGTVVTLDGVVFHQSGLVSGGQPRTSKPFALGYERDMEAIPKEIVRIQKSMEVSEQEVEGLRGRLQEAEAALAALIGEGEDALDRRLNMQDALAQRQQKLAQLRGELRGLVTAHESLKGQIAEVERDEARLAEEREGVLAEAEESALTAKHLGRASGAFTGRRGELEMAVEAAATEVARADAAFRSLSVQRDDAEAGLSRLEAQRSSKDVQLRALEIEIESLTQSVGADEAELVGVRAELEALIERTQPAQGGTTHHLEARERDLHSQVISAERRLFEAERSVLEAESELRKWRTEVETMGRRMEEDGLSVTPEGDVRVSDGTHVEAPVWMAAEDQDDERGGLRPMQGGAPIDPEALMSKIEGLRAQLRRIGPVNLEAQADYASMRERHDFLTGQVEDLKGAEASLKRAIKELTGLMKKRFEETFAKVAESFESFFQEFFGGGHAKLSLTDPKNPDVTGVEIEARPPGKRTKSLAQLSGGEKALTAVSLLFALLSANPSPYCVLDEVDAMLDEANVGRFTAALKKLAKKTQFIVVTHNRRTIEISDSIYGISMAPDNASRVLSMRLADVTGAA
jgi:chromosome segregation protein